MKKLVLTLAICLGCMGILGAQNIWKPINGTGILGVGPDGSIFAYGEYGSLSRSQDEGETWQIVLGQETSFTGHINASCFAVSNEGRMCVFNDNQQTVVYSDDNGDTWQQTPTLSSCAMPTKKGICAPTNDIFVIWAEEGEINFTLDGGETWDGWVLSSLENSESVSDLLVNENGDVYVSVAYYIMNIVGIYHSTLSDIQNWELVAAEDIGIEDMELDPEGNVVACGWIDEGSIGFQHTPGFYLFDGTSLAISDGGIVYTPHFTGLQAVLSYSTDHGEHFTEIGEHLPLVDIAPGGDNAHIFKGADNHLYFDGGGEYWKSISDADHILNYDYIPLIQEDKSQQWNVVYIVAASAYPDVYSTDIQSIDGDIALEGVDYKLVWTDNVYDALKIAGAVREENRRVYFRRYYGGYYENEVLLYDFNLTVGDTVTVNWLSTTLMVLEESEVEVDGVMRRRLGLGYPTSIPELGEIEEYWIEGVGSTFGFLNSGYGSSSWVGSFPHLLCYYENDNLIWDNEDFDECVMNSDGAPSTFAPQGAEWYFDVFNPWGTHPEYERFFVDGDTIIQGHQCSIITQYFVDTGHEGGEFVYEEDNKVYWFNPTLNAFTTLYDFDAEAGESWYCEVASCSHLVTVDSIGNVTWNGHTYRVQWVRFNDDLPAYRGKIIEGIGYERGLFPSIYVCNGLEVFDAREIEYLRCYIKDDVMLYHEGEYDCDAIGYNVEDGTLNAYCEAPMNFGGSPISDQGTYGAQLWWNKPFASHWFHYDEKPYAGSVYRNSWGIKIPAEEIQRGDLLTHVAFYRAGGQDQPMEYRFAFGFEGETEPDSWDYLPGNSAQVEPGPDGWVMAKLGSPIECEEGKCLWIVLEAPNVMGNPAAYCQASGNPNACWSSGGMRLATG